MTDPFAMGLEALFSAPGSMAAVYAPLSGAPLSIRVVRTVQVADQSFGSTSIPVDAAVFEIRRSEVAQPERGAVLDIGGEQFVIDGEPRLDVEGLTWRCEAPPAP